MNEPLHSYYGNRCPIGTMPLCSCSSALQYFGLPFTFSPGDYDDHYDERSQQEYRLENLTDVLNPNPLYPKRTMNLAQKRWIK